MPFENVTVKILPTTRTNAIDKFLEMADGFYFTFPFLHGYNRRVLSIRKTDIRRVTIHTVYSTMDYNAYRRNETDRFFSWKNHEGKVGRYRSIEKFFEATGLEEHGIMGQMATYTGRKIEWDQALSAGHVFGPAKCDFSTEPPVKPRPDGTYPVRIPGVSRLGQQI